MVSPGVLPRPSPSDATGDHATRSEALIPHHGSPTTWSQSSLMHTRTILRLSQRNTLQNSVPTGISNSGAPERCKTLEGWEARTQFRCVSAHSFTAASNVLWKTRLNGRVSIHLATDSIHTVHRKRKNALVQFIDNLTSFYERSNIIAVEFRLPCPTDSWLAIVGSPGVWVPTGSSQWSFPWSASRIRRDGSSAAAPTSHWSLPAESFWPLLDPKTTATTITLTRSLFSRRQATRDKDIQTCFSAPCKLGLDPMTFILKLLAILKMYLYSKNIIMPHDWLSKV